ncbi:hypothetical protein EDB86DRAFT_3076893 [Lactarius hatsudake]|nr:hypothetical protein EDB86DRAFT_3076893 [Lactarius hatsudake]
MSQSRVVLDGHSTGLIAQYDIHPQVLADRHLSLFRERNIAAHLDKSKFPYVELWFCSYSVDSSRKLYHKVKVVDVSSDSIELNTTQSGVEQSQGQSRIRQTFMNSLAVDVIDLLATLKDTHDSARWRVKDDLKGSAATYADFPENTLPKFERAYFRKC